ncbi:peroxidase isoform X2 [Nilaparvata lugens]|nr:peroxidase isoform X2 [Nilaparvata lugens]XP_039290631.1 peroxidase isoform X2 [Nilaparvata lugens]XP_039290632.1 peroxidase isoform X2 [Nilaparvata lugens]
MVCSSMAVAIVMWSVMQFGSQSVMMAVMSDASQLLSAPALTLQAYLDSNGAAVPLDRPRRAVRRLPSLDAKDLESSVEFARSLIDKQARHEANIAGSGVTIRRGTPAHGLLAESTATQEAIEHGLDAQVALKASQFIASKYCVRSGIDDESCANQISLLPLALTSLGKKCSSHYKTSLYCSDLNMFRSYDGSCNHRTHSAWGRSLTPYRRLLAADYEDGLHVMKGSRKGKSLVSPRQVSVSLISNLDNPDTSKTLAVMQWGQFVAHDMAHTASSRMLTTGDTISCCSANGKKLSPRHQHSLCAAIDIPSTDPFYSKLGHTCMPYVRSLMAIRSDCTFGPVQQMNQVTHYLDGSVIYGSTAEVATSLRQFHNGRLRTKIHNEREFLPSPRLPQQICINNGTCFQSGDERVNSQPGLAALHTLFLREHNRMASRLSILNPSWDDERLYQEARRIVIAEIQHITYNEWLPVVLGVKYMKRIGLTIQQKGYSAKFNDQIDASTSNSFATAAMAFINSMVEGRIGLYEEDRNAELTVQLKDIFNKPDLVQKSTNLDALVRGLATQSSQSMDLQFSEAMTNYLYKENESYGLDRLSLDIQRGRDHGLPGYNVFREFCGLPKVKDFSQLTDTIPVEVVGKLRKLYKSVDEVDLVVGGLAESRGEEGLIGHTFKCILAEQFARTRIGDRFFYDIGGQPGSFNEAQLKQIKKANLARIFCDNSDNIRNMQAFVFYKPSTPNNDLVPCGEVSLIEQMDLEPWREEQSPSLLPFFIDPEKRTGK